DGRTTAGDLGALHRLADPRSRVVRLLRLSSQPAAPGGPVSAVKLHTKIVLGLVLGAAGGVAANTLAPGAAWVRWTGDNGAGRGRAWTCWASSPSRSSSAPRSR